MYFSHEEILKSPAKCDTEAVTKNKIKWEPFQWSHKSRRCIIYIAMRRRQNTKLSHCTGNFHSIAVLMDTTKIFQFLFTACSRPSAPGDIYHIIDSYRKYLNNPNWARSGGDTLVWGKMWLQYWRCELLQSKEWIAISRRGRIRSFKIV